jgi:short-subunit dehydrogenase
MGMIDLNVSALTAVTYLTLPYLCDGAQVYQIASFSAFLPLPYVDVYAATKAYVLSFSRALNVELKYRGIRVMAVCPKWVRTEFFDRAAEQNDVVTYYDRFYTVDQVVARALRDMKRGKDVSVCGVHARTEARLLKLLPPKLAMKIWCRQQKK